MALDAYGNVVATFAGYGIQQFVLASSSWKVITPFNPTICAGASQTFTVNPSGGTPGYTFLWIDGSTGTTFTTNASGTYPISILCFHSL